MPFTPRVVVAPTDTVRPVELFWISKNSDDACTLDPPPGRVYVPSRSTLALKKPVSAWKVMVPTACADSIPAILVNHSGAE